MIPIGFGLAWFGYALAFWGHALVKGYNLSFAQVVSPVSFYRGAWPPPDATNTVLFPDGKPDNNATAGPSQPGSGANRNNTAGGLYPQARKTSNTGQGSQLPTESRF